MSRERCDDCGYWQSIHFAKDGRFLGCPLRASNQLGRVDALPRITVRVGKAGTRKDKILVTWPDMLDTETGQIVVWDMNTGDQYVDSQLELQRNTRRAKKDKEIEIQAEVEYQLGGSVRVVNSGHGKAE